jgi:hypothetical protein
MAEISYGHRFPAVVIQHAVRLYLCFTLSYRDVEDLLAERGLDVSYETVRSWVLKLGPVTARRLWRRRPRPINRWHLDEMVVRVAGERMYLWPCCRQRGRRPRHAGSAPARYPGAPETDAQASQEARLCAEVAGNRQAVLLRRGIPASAADLLARTGLRRNQIAPRTRIRWCDDESARCNASNRFDPLSVSSACTPPYTTPSTFNAISSRGRRSGSFEPRRRTNGGMRSCQCDRTSWLGLVLLNTS